MNMKTFKLGEPYPQWFLGYNQSNIQYNLNEDGSLHSLKIRQGRKSITAVPGDTIGLLENGTLIVIPKSAADKFM